MELTLKIVDAAGEVLAKTNGQDEIFLVYRNAYAPGDRIIVESSHSGHIVLALDDAVAPALVYLKGQAYSLAVPFDGRRACWSPRAFDTGNHRILVRAALPAEVASRRNLALNPWDDHANTTLFPHASANAETRGEAAFAARNAIDGEKANDDHGFWPYTSWGINRDPQATLTVDFGRAVLIDEIALYLRADFPHDSWWENASVTFSDGQSISFPLIKSDKVQRVPVEPRMVEWIRLHSLIKADDPSPYPALTQIEIWGREAVD